MADPDLWPWYLRPLTAVGDRFRPSPFLGAGIVSAHGYPPDTPGVQGILYAWGRGVAAGRALPEARMIDVHPTVTALLGIQPGHPVDGEAIGALASIPARR